MAPCIKLTCLFTLAISAGGCASTPAVRTLAEQTGVYVTSLREGTANFVAAQNRLNAGNEIHLQRLAADAAEFRAQADRQRMAWTSAGNAKALETEQAVAAVGADEVVGQLQSRALKPAIIGSESGKAYGEATDALVEIGTKPDIASILAGLAQYASDIQQSYDELRKESDEDAAATSESTAAASDASAPAESQPTGGPDE
jgi:hypothetical protein